MLRTRCILTEPHEADGQRISVMSRHTYTDGKTPDQRLQGQFDVWMPTFAPPLKLIGAYTRAEIKWGQFAADYLQYLRSSYMVTEVRNLATYALRQDITLLCIEDSPEQCHRRLLAEECCLYQSDLELKIE